MQRIHVFILQLVLLLSTGDALAQAFSPADIVNHTVSLNRAVHFSDPDGSDVLVPAGGYWVAAQEDTLMMLSLDSGEMYTLSATAGEHDSEIFSDLAVSTAGTEEQPDAHVISYLFVDGSALVAEGSYSGIQARGLLDPAKRKAAADALAKARRQAAAAKKQALAQAAAVADAARERAQDAAAALLARAQPFLDLSCADKFAAIESVTAQLAKRMQVENDAAVAKTQAQRPLLDAIIEAMVERAIQSDRPLIDSVVALARELQDPRRRAEMADQIADGVCGVDPEATAQKIERTAISLYQDARASMPGAISTRGVRDFMDDNFTLSFDLSLGAGTPAMAGVRSTAGAAGIGIAIGKRGNPPCDNPNLARACVRAYWYRHIGGSTPDAGVTVPLSVGVWRVNPSGLQGRYTNVGGSISFEKLAAIYAGGSGAATAATGGAAAPTEGLTIAGLTGIGLDVALDRNAATFIECALANSDDYMSVCRQWPRPIGLIVNIGLSYSTGSVSLHRVSGSTWTWWWENGHMTDIQGPTRLWKDAVDYVMSR